VNDILHLPCAGYYNCSYISVVWVTAIFALHLLRLDYVDTLRLCSNNVHYFLSFLLSLWYFLKKWFIQHIFAWLSSNSRSIQYLLMYFENHLAELYTKLQFVIVLLFSIIHRVLCIQDQKG